MRKFRRLFYKYIKCLEMLIAIFLTGAVMIAGFQIVQNFILQILHGISDFDFNSLLGNIFTLIIGVEFIRMILKPTSGNVLEVVLFTVAKSLVLAHSSMNSYLLGILALGILFAIRKYLFVEITPLEHELLPAAQTDLAAHPYQKTREKEPHEPPVS
ncbi:MAG: hypothetical protein LBT44_01550, partial [Clostridiales bacterium]|nr:hypothetical protein [Clostridiales bacterium]